jgi:hypothetical protein
MVPTLTRGGCVLARFIRANSGKVSKIFSAGERENRGKTRKGEEG